MIILVGSKVAPLAPGSQVFIAVVSRRVVEMRDRNDDIDFAADFAREIIGFASGFSIGRMP
jgi:hypothetical protein